jgi:hypothetical protein
MASKRRIRRNACTSKRAYPTQTDAVRALILLKQRPYTEPGLCSYRCRWCKQWHLGRSNRQKFVTLRALRVCLKTSSASLASQS